MTISICSVNGVLQSEISATDRGLAYGDGVFRTLAIHQGKPRVWDMHWRKLVADAAAIALIAPSEEIVLQSIKTLFDGGSGVLKIIITRGDGVRGYAVSTSSKPNTVLIKSDFPQYPAALAEHGVALHLCSLRLAHQPQLAGIKHLNRLENVLARMEWQDTQYSDGLLLDQHGHVTECTMSNIFARYANRLVTPRLDLCGVSGVTRERILEAAASLGYIAEEVRISLDELKQADEVLICNSLIGVWQVRSVDGRHWPHHALAAQLNGILQD